MKLRQLDWRKNEHSKTHSVRIDNKMLSLTLFECRLKEYDTPHPQVECNYLEIFGIRQPLIDTRLDYYAGTRQRYFDSVDEAKSYFEGLWNDMFQPLIFDESYADEEKRKILNEAKMVSARLTSLLRDYSYYENEGVKNN